MHIHIRPENLELTQAIKEYVEKKVRKLEKYFTEDIEANAYVNLKVYRDQHHVEVTIPMPNLLLRAEEKNLDMYASVDLIVDKLERQIRKHKTKINRKARTHGSIKQIINSQILQEQDHELEEEIGAFEIVRTKRFAVKPMDSEEAILQMNMLGHNFFVYRDSETNAMCVVYKRKDDQYGLIEAN